jgi:hypothetical protein
MNSTRIKKLYDYVYNIAREVQMKTQTGEVIDGRSIWQSIEKQISHIDLSDLGLQIYYNDELQKKYTIMDDIDIKFNMSANENDPISNHYFLQLKNLVVKKSNFIIQINRILQIAFNVGQLSIFIENNKLDIDRKDEISRFIYMNDMLNLDTYVSIDKQKEIDKLLDDHLVYSIISKSSLKDLQNLRDLQNGGNNIYYQKYMKYKIKYNNLKKYC